MIYVKLKETPDGEGFDIISSVTFNSIARKLKEELQEKLKDESCDIHNQECILTVIVDNKSDNWLKVEHTNFCCNDFKEKIKVSIK